MMSQCLNDIEVTNIKASFKLDTPVELEYVKDRCRLLEGKLGIVWYHTISTLCFGAYNLPC